MWRRSATTGFIVDASTVLQEVVGVLSETEHRSSMRASGTAARSVVLFRTSAANYRSELVIVPFLFVEDKRLAITLSGQKWCHTKSCLEKEGSIHVPPSLRPEKS